MIGEREMRIAGIACLVLAAAFSSAEPIKRMQYTAISPDGSTIAFSYH